MKTLETKSKHYESMYLIQTGTGSFILISYRPTDAYEGKRGSDLSALWEVPYVENVSHDLPINEKVTILRNYVRMVHPAKQSAVIVAKKQRYWDYSKPIGQREEVTFESNKWSEYFSYYRNQKNA